MTEYNVEFEQDPFEDRRRQQRIKDGLEQDNQSKENSDGSEDGEGTGVTSGSSEAQERGSKKEKG